jgi:16S rRNA (guanine(1405)-N(7))-methyltransferase
VAADDPAADVVAEVARRVLVAPKYRALDPAVVDRFAAEAVARTRTPAEAVKHAKRKLHQAYGAFAAGSAARAVEACVDAVLAGADVRDACRAAMAAHASTAERVGHLDELAGTLAGWCGAPASVSDLACGLGPLAIPWLDLAPGAAYDCCDIDRDLVAALGRLDEILPVTLRARTCDLVAQPPPAPGADLVLLLKTPTTLEQQRPGATAVLLARLRAPHVVVSLPAGSLGGRRAYGTDAVATVERAAARTGYRVDGSARVGGEVVCHLTGRGTGGTGG